MHGPFLVGRFIVACALVSVTTDCTNAFSLVHGGLLRGRLLTDSAAKDRVDSSSGGSGTVTSPAGGSSASGAGAPADGSAAASSGSSASGAADGSTGPAASAASGGIDGGQVPLQNYQQSQQVQGEVTDETLTTPAPTLSPPGAHLIRITRLALGVDYLHTHWY